MEEDSLYSPREGFGEGQEDAHQDQEGQEGPMARHQPALVQDVYEVVDHIRREMSERTTEMKEAIHRGTGKLYHVVTSNNWIVQFRIGVDGNLIFERTVKSINVQTQKLKKARQKILDAGKRVPISAQKQWRKTITGNPNKRIRDHMKETPQVKLLDKVSFTAGVVVITFTEFLIMRHPDWFPPFFTWLMLLLFVLRYFMYKASKFHLFMLDFCYVVNISCMLQALFFPNCVSWFSANFVLTMGPLCMAIPTWRNSLVFHSLDKLTSFFLHAFPPMLCHLFRWGLIPTEAITPDLDWSYSGILYPALGMYAAWQVTYLFLTEVVYRRELEADPNLITSIRWLSRDRQHPMNRLICRACRSWGVIGPDEYLDSEALYCKALFVTVQFVYMTLTMLPSFVVYGSYHASCCWLMFCFLIGTWNGASFYIEVFSKRYNMKFDKTEPAVAESVLVSDDAPELLPASDSSVDGGDEEDRTKKISTSSAEEAAAVAAATKMSSARSETSTPPRSAEEGEEFEPVSRASTTLSDELNLDESQALELFEILQKLESKDSSSSSTLGSSKPRMSNPNNDAAAVSDENHAKSD